MGSRLSAMRRTSCAWLVWLLFAGMSAAQTAPAPFRSTPAKQKKFYFEYVYNYAQSSYEPPVILVPVARSTASYAEPEQTFIAQTSAMLAGDYEWWFSGWSKESQEQIKKRDLERNRTPADWKAIWERALTGKQIRMLERLETGPFVFVVWSLRTPAAEGQEEKEVFRSVFACRRENDRWVATQELAEDKLFQHYTDGKERISIVVR